MAENFLVQPMSEEITVKEIMSSPPITVSLEESVIKAARIMAENKIGCVIVVNDEGKPVGIVTRRDLVEKVLAKAKDPLKTKVKDVMSSPLIYVSPNTPILEAAKLMSRKDIRHLPVIDADGLVGVVSDRDILTVAPEYIELMVVRKGGI